MTDDRAARLPRSRAFSARMVVIEALGLIAIAGFTAAAIVMLWPASSDPFYAGRVADLEPLVPQHFPNERFWLVLQEDGEVRAFYDRDPRTGCIVRRNSPEYFERRRAYAALQRNPDGVFRADCSGSVFHPDGRVYFGPTPRSLDYYAVEVSGGHVYVDLSRVLEGVSR